MNNINKRYLIIALIVLAGVFLYFGGGGLFNNGSNGMMNHNGGMNTHSWGWLTIVLTVCIVGLVGWFLYKKKH